MDRRDFLRTAAITSPLTVGFPGYVGFQYWRATRYDGTPVDRDYYPDTCLEALKVHRDIHAKIDTLLYRINTDYNSPSIEDLNEAADALLANAEFFKPYVTGLKDQVSREEIFKLYSGEPYQSLLENLNDKPFENIIKDLESGNKAGAYQKLINLLTSNDKSQEVKAAAVLLVHPIFGALLTEQGKQQKILKELERSIDKGFRDYAGSPSMLAKFIVDTYDKPGIIENHSDTPYWAIINVVEYQRAYIAEKLRLGKFDERFFLPILSDKKVPDDEIKQIRFATRYYDHGYVENDINKAYYQKTGKDISMSTEIPQLIYHGEHKEALRLVSLYIKTLPPYIDLATQRRTYGRHPAEANWALDRLVPLLRNRKPTSFGVDEARIDPRQRDFAARFARV